MKIVLLMLVEIIKSASFKRKAKTNSLIHEKDFTFKSFMLELYRSYYKDKPSTLLENFDLFEELGKKVNESLILQTYLKNLK